MLGLSMESRKIKESAGALVGFALAVALAACGGSSHSFGVPPSDGGSGGRVDAGGGTRPTGGGASGGAGMGDEPDSEQGGNNAAAGEAGAAPDSPLPNCGNGQQDPGEDCDLGAGNEASAYGADKCSDACTTAPFCGAPDPSGASEAARRPASSCSSNRDGGHPVSAEDGLSVEGAAE